jgi:hypothetical protein
MFYNNYNKVRLPLEDIYIGFLIMLKGRVLTYYYSSIQGNRFTFKQIIYIIKEYFYTEENC